MEHRLIFIDSQGETITSSGDEDTPAIINSLPFMIPSVGDSVSFDGDRKYVVVAKTFIYEDEAHSVVVVLANSH